MHSRRASSVTIVILILLCLLLSALAFLQYQWIGRVSDWEGERLQKGLQADAQRFSDEFNNWITQIYNAFHLTPDIYRQADLVEEMARANGRVWESQFAPLLASVYVVALTDADAEIRLFHSGEDKLEKTDWPEELSRLRARLLEALSGVDHASYDVPFGFLDDVPGLVIQQNAFLQTDGEQTESFPLLVVVSLNHTELFERWIPALVESVFTRGDSIDFDVAIAALEPREDLLFTSDPALTAASFSDPDVIVDFFRYSDLDGWLRLPDFSRVGDLRATLDRLAEGLPIAPDSQGERQAGVLKRDPAQNAAPSARNSRSSLLSGSVTRLTSERFRLTDEGSWRLLIKWKEGTMADAIGKIRLRNIAISFGILLFLGLSVALVLLSSRRARGLASQQLRFVGGITHDFRTPVSVICAGAENLAFGVTKDQGETAKYGRIILAEGRKLADMVEQALRFSGIRIARNALHFDRCEIAELVEKALAACRPQLREGDIAVGKNLPEERCIVLADRQAMQAAIQNLIANAVKYSGDAGRIDVTVTKRPIVKGGKLLVSVRDYGMGIPEADKSHIFEPFYRGTNVRGSKISGSGLGLAFVKEVVNLHGGRVGFRSEQGTGTTFFIQLSEARRGKEGTGASRKDAD